MFTVVRHRVRLLCIREYFACLGEYARRCRPRESRRGTTAFGVRVARQRRPVCEYRHAAGGRRPVTTTVVDWLAGGVTGTRVLPGVGAATAVWTCPNAHVHTRGRQRTHRHWSRPDGGSARQAAWGGYGRACVLTYAHEPDHNTRFAGTFRRRCV